MIHRRGNLAELKSSHTTEAIRARLSRGPSHTDLRDLIFGAIDGTVTTFAVVSSVSGAELSAGIVLILGVANLVADGFSMGISNFLGTRAEEQQRTRTRQDEEYQVKTIPEGEREEIRQIFAAKGFTGDDLERVVEVITSDRRVWVNEMLQEEYGFPPELASPWRTGIATYIGFMAAGLIPLIPFIYQRSVSDELANPFFWSLGAAGVSFFAIGALKSFFVEQRWYWAGLEILTIGGAAAGLAYAIGVLLKGAADSL